MSSGASDRDLQPMGEIERARLREYVEEVETLAAMIHEDALAARRAVEDSGLPAYAARMAVGIRGEKLLDAADELRRTARRLAAQNPER